MEDRGQFLCGVVEGFYGRPWSMDQRKVLFQWMHQWGLNTYLYGPKDDLKHRLLWREVYSPEEEGQLRTLVVEAASRGVSFVYALSPGQDIVFSSACDLTLLKRKLKQVSDLGCQAFAILFDDIDHSMCQADSEAFSSFAHAQVSVANEIYRFLGEPPVFLFCPTEYCGSLCSPSVSKSIYLQTLGENLQPNISVIWTGSKVISRNLSVDCLAEVASVLQRPPLIWDNLHANDYDSRRLFLGPFKGREPQLRSHLRGLLLNPNCEFEANYIPLHTLGSWHRTSPCGEEGEDEPEYCPDRALSAALHNWMEELNQPLQPGRQTPNPTSRSKTPDRTERPPAQAKPLPMFPLSSSSPPSSPAKGGVENGGEVEVRRTPAEGPKHKAQGRVPCGGKGLLSESQVRLLVGLHYLPHEHGPAAQKLLQDLTWLKTHCHLVSTNGKKTAPQKVEEWRGRASRLISLCEDIAELHCSVVGGVNRAVLYDLYPYVWDLRNTALVAKAFVCWLDGRVLGDSSTLGTWKNCFHSHILLALLSECLNKIRAIGLNTTAVVCDQGTNNVALYKQLGISPITPFFMHSGVKVFALHDPPHLLKNTRSNLEKYNFKISTEHSSKTIKWSYLQKFFEFDSQLPIRKAPKLTKGHFQLNSFSKMHVNMAAQVLSHTVAAGLYTYVALGKLPGEAVHTAEFVELIDSLFDSFNSRCGTTTGAELLGVDSEPWVFKGGVSGEVQMLLPIGSSTELFTHPPPLFPTSRLYNVRPYHSKDKVELYRMVRQLHLRTQGGKDSNSTHPDVIGDRCLGACLAVCPEYSFVLEDELGVCGCVLGVGDVRTFIKRCHATWMPAMRDKYPAPRTGPSAAPAYTQDLVLLMEEDQGEYPDSLLHHFPSQLRLDALPQLVDASVSRTLLTALLAALKANGSQGVFCEVQPTDRQRLEFLTKLGFLEILRGEARSREGVVLGRLL
ncbi:Protein O-GlcNAcase [Merluccius polli]|uniref:protein O-GlcNAcase n=1 Tax=Merluccius polli TaxID=89951 RepID=A0AA47M5D2_MERPO|nr:Protein O-GlcNAcase [Merluccius polli]